MLAPSPEREHVLARRAGSDERDRDPESVVAVLYVTASVVVGVLAVLTGARLARLV